MPRDGSKRARLTQFPDCSIAINESEERLRALDRRLFRRRVGERSGNAERKEEREVKAGETRERGMVDGGESGSFSGEEAEERREA